MKIISYGLLLGFTTIILFSCGKSVDKDSLEGRVASLISEFDGVTYAFSMDLKSILKKSGIKKGSIPKQYLETITPYLESVEKSVNMEKQVFLVPILNPKNMGNSNVIVLFEVKNAEALKKEFKEMNMTLKKDGDLEYGMRGNEAAGIFKGNTGFIVMNGENPTDVAALKNIGKALDGGSTVDGVVDFVTLKADMTMYTTAHNGNLLEGDENLGEWQGMIKKMAELSEGTYSIGQMNFEDQEMTFTMEAVYGSGMKKYLPLTKDDPSEEAIDVVNSETIFAMHMNLEFAKIMEMLMDFLDEKSKQQVNQGLAMLGGYDKFKEMFTGEMSMAMGANKTEEPDVAFFLGVNDMKQMRTLLDGFGAFAGVKKKGDNYEMDGGKIIIKGKSLKFITKNASNSKGKPRKMGDFKFGKEGFSAFVDFKNVLKSPLAEDEDMPELIRDLDYATAYQTGDGFVMVVRSLKKGENILETMIKAGIEMQEREMERQREMEAYWDSFEDDEAFYSAPEAMPEERIEY